MKTIIESKGTEFEQNLKDLAIIDTADRAGKPIMIDQEDLEEALSNTSVEISGMESHTLQDSKNVTPTASSQNVEPDEGYDGLKKVVVAAAPVDEAITAELSTEEDVVISPSEGNVGIASVTVPRVTADIDANIIAANIKSGVTILGVEGTYEGEAN